LTQYRHVMDRQTDGIDICINIARCIHEYMRTRDKWWWLWRTGCHYHRQIFPRCTRMINALKRHTSRNFR